MNAAITQDLTDGMTLDEAKTMRAIVQTGYGTSDVLELRDIEQPTIGDDEVLVRARAAGVHAGDYFMMSGKPFPVRFAIGFPRP
jgi:NADPH:quinone reductase-like Zn-dependent oxidoreductase